MILSIIGNKWIYANEIYSKVGSRQFTFAEVGDPKSRMRSNMRQMVDCKILSVEKIKVGRIWVPHYKLTDEAVVKIRRYG
jgi:hypothetical protein